MEDAAAPCPNRLALGAARRTLKPGHEVTRNLREHLIITYETLHEQDPTGDFDDLADELLEEEERE